MGIKLEMEEGRTEIEKIGVPNGTNIKIKDIFFNTPVRYKFLKTDKIALGHITDLVSRLILCYPKIHFKLINNDIPVIISATTDRPINCIFDIYGKKVTKSVVDFSYTDPLFEINGFLGQPSLSQSTTLSSSIFVNKRYIKSPLIKKALDEAYKDYVMVHKHPFFIIFLKVDPATVDFNIHPTKKVIRFENETILLKRLVNVLREIVEDKFGGGIKNIKKSSKSVISETLKELVLDNQEKNEQTSTNEAADTNSERKGDTIEDNKSSIKLDQMYDIVDKQKDYHKKTAEIPEKGEKTRGFFNRDNWITTETLPRMKLINEAGQLNKLYFIFEAREGFYILDQHAAHERINYEAQIELFKEGGLKKQSLLLPITFDVSINEKDFFEEVIPQLSQFGFEVDSMGSNTFAIRTVPANYKNLSDLNLVKDLVREIIEFGKQSSLDKIYDKIIKYIACHMSIRGGDEIDNPVKARNLLIKLSKCKNPNHCAHGRPTMLYFSYKEIDKKFHRTQ
ncbi:MAG: hypothetical protein GY870_01100, partial [archaeon]|nr:hypothetical protein [archaeon]